MWRIAGLTVAFVWFAFMAEAQQKLPELSPPGFIRQRVGFTNMAVSYERLAARGRKIFGELVPFGKLWRTGAGNCTKIAFSEGVEIGHQRIAKGKYSLLTIPGETEWTVILNSDTTLYGTDKYNAAMDVIRFQAKVHRSERYFESLSIDIDIVPFEALFYISWENTQVSFRVDTHTDKRINDFVIGTLLTGKSTDPEEYAMTAEHYYFHNSRLDMAELLVNRAIAMKPEAWYLRLRVDVFEKENKFKEAIAAAGQANEINRKRTDWTDAMKRQSEAEYNTRIETMKRKITK